MMIDLARVPWPILDAIRQNAGAENGEDTRHDAQLAKEPPRRLLMRYAEWHLGDGQWGNKIVDAYEALRKAAK
jgi:hypothetical protein